VSLRFDVYSIVLLAVCEANKNVLSTNLQHATDKRSEWKYKAAVQSVSLAVGLCAPEAMDARCLQISESYKGVVNRYYSMAGGRNRMSDQAGVLLEDRSPEKSTIYRQKSALVNYRRGRLFWAAIL